MFKYDVSGCTDYSNREQNNSYCSESRRYGRKKTQITFMKRKTKWGNVRDKVGRETAKERGEINDKARSDVLKRVMGEYDYQLV